MSKHADDLPPKTKERLYTIWMTMWGRVRDKTNPWYGGRGITAADEFRSYSAFREYILLELLRLPKPWESLDRIDNDKGYEPGNLRWATAKDQGRNRSTNRIVTIEGKEMTIAEAAEVYGAVCYSQVLKRLGQGWSLWEALKTPSTPHRVRGTLRNQTKKNTEDLVEVQE